MKVILGHKDRGGWTFAVLLVFMIFSAGRIRAGTSGEIYFDVLVAGGKAYTNATIIRGNPAYAVVAYQNGLARVAMSNLPALYQAQFGYTPEKAAEFLAEEDQAIKQRRAALVARQEAYRRSVAAAVGTNQPVQIMAILDETTYNGIPLCSVKGMDGGILVRNLPDSIRRFFADYRQVQVDIANCTAQIKDLDSKAVTAQNITALVIQRGTDQDFINANAAEKRIYADRRNAEDRLVELNGRWEQMTANYDSLTTIMAYPSGESYGNKPIWISTGVP